VDELKFGRFKTFDVKGAVSTALTGISNSGQLCGFFVNAQNVTRAFLMPLTGGAPIEFPGNLSTTTQFLGVNKNGVAVGFYMRGGMPNGLVFNPASGKWITVNDPSGVQGTTLNGINDNGQIVGFYVDAAGNTHGVLINGVTAP
jgi:hypothetical protein